MLDFVVVVFRLTNGVSDHEADRRSDADPGDVRPAIGPSADGEFDGGRVASLEDVTGPFTCADDLTELAGAGFDPCATVFGADLDGDGAVCIDEPDSIRLDLGNGELTGLVE